MSVTGSAHLDSRWVLLPVVMAVALIGATYFVNERLRQDIAQQVREIDVTRQRLWLIFDLLSQMSRAESSQRGYLLTRQPKYLSEYQESSQRIGALTTRLQAHYEKVPEQRQVLFDMLGLSQAKLQELQSTLALAQQDRMSAAKEVVATGTGQQWMENLRAKAELMTSLEQASMEQGTREWQRLYATSRYIVAIGMLITVILILIAGVFVRQDLRRRSSQTRELDRLVNERTRELSLLSTHLQQVAERERAVLARELHDELGSLLVSVKMDLAQLARQVDVTRAEIVPRWQRIQAAISAGVDLKRRIIEELRPTLLDNMGLVAALKWQMEQRCSAAQLRWSVSCPESELALNEDCAIALFRVAQESLTNVIKHARASKVTLTLMLDEKTLCLRIDDDGAGLANRIHAGHGVRGMRQRMVALGGHFRISNLSPKGLRVEAEVPSDAYIPQ